MRTLSALYVMSKCRCNFSFNSIWNRNGPVNIYLTYDNSLWVVYKYFYFNLPICNVTVIFVHV